MLILPRFLALFASCTAVWAQSPSPTEVHDPYLFLAGKVKVAAQKQLLPIRKFDGEYFHLEGSEKRLSSGSSVSAWLGPTMVVSKFYADVAKLSYRLSEEGNTKDEPVVVHLDDEQQFLQGIDMAPETKAQLENQLRRFDSIQRIDTLSGSCQITSTRPIKNAYAALVLSIDQVIPRIHHITRRTTVSVVPVGDLARDEAKPFEFTAKLPAFEAMSAELEIFLFDGSGRYVATNLSRGLEKLTPEQLEELRTRDEEVRKKQTEPSAKDQPEKSKRNPLIPRLKWSRR